MCFFFINETTSFKLVQITSIYSWKFKVGDSESGINNNITAVVFYKLAEQSKQTYHAILT